jgi:hypothetical protein
MIMLGCTTYFMMVGCVDADVESLPMIECLIL